MSDNRISYEEHMLGEASKIGEVKSPGLDTPAPAPNTVHGRCARRKDDGTPCRARALSGSSLCYFHDPASARARIEASKRGGQKKRAAVLPSDTSDFPLNDAADTSALLTRTINQVRRGELDVKVANSVGYLLNIKLKAMDQAQLLKRLAVLERALKDKAPAFGLLDLE